LQAPGTRHPPALNLLLMCGVSWFDIQQHDESIDDGYLSKWVSSTSIFPICRAGNKLVRFIEEQRLNHVLLPDFFAPSLPVENTLTSKPSVDSAIAQEEQCEH
jgi:hypothetical protein